MSKRTVLVVLLFVGVFAFALSALESLPLDEETKDELRAKLTTGFLLAISTVLLAVALFAAPWYIAAGAGGLVLFNTAAWHLTRRLAKHVASGGKSEGEGGGGLPMKCGDEGSCGKVIDGKLCLGFHCL